MALTQLQEKRVHQRVLLSTEVEFSTPDGDYTGEVVNVSLGGMLIKTKNPPDPGNSILVMLKLPSTERSLLLRSSVVWVSSQGSADDMRSMGVVFDSKSEQDKQDLTEYIFENCEEDFSGKSDPTVINKQSVASVKSIGQRPLIALVADDNALLRNVLADLLGDEGFEVQQATDGQDAMQKVVCTHYDLIFLDIHMPVLDGLAFLKELRGRGISRDVIVVTSDSQLETAIEAVRLGASDFIRKPIDKKEIQECVDRVLASSRIKSLNREYQHHLEKKVMEQEDRIRYLFYEAIQSLIFTIEAKDEYTKGHSMRVTTYATWLAKALKLDFEEASAVNTAARLHDIGKLSVSDSILHKKGPLTKEEFSIIQQHPERGCKILTPIIPNQPMRAVLHHHERWDGGGYPQGLKGKEIPLEARVISLCDAFDAMTSERVYRDKMDFEQAFSEVEEKSGTQFDPEMTPVFLDAFSKNFTDELEN
jgi:putative two-component system response regulator